MKKEEFENVFTASTIYDTSAHTYVCIFEPNHLVKLKHVGNIRISLPCA